MAIARRMARADDLAQLRAEIINTSGAVKRAVHPNQLNPYRRRRRTAPTGWGSLKAALPQVRVKARKDP